MVPPVAFTDAPRQPGSSEVCWDYIEGFRIESSVLTPLNDPPKKPRAQKQIEPVKKARAVEQERFKLKIQSDATGDDFETAACRLVQSGAACRQVLQQLLGTEAQQEQRQTKQTYQWKPSPDHSEARSDDSSQDEDYSPSPLKRASISTSPVSSPVKRRCLQPALLPLHPNKPSIKVLHCPCRCTLWMRLCSSDITIRLRRN